MVLETSLSGFGQMNPTPAAYKDSDMLVELYLSIEKLVMLLLGRDVWPFMGYGSMLLDYI
jgi:hypothetical protein